VKILVTGATGFIGGHIVNALRRAGHDPIALVRATSNTRYLAELAVELRTGDVTDRPSLERACRDIDCIVHAAAVVAAYGDWAHYQHVGVEGTRHLVEAAQRAAVRRFIHIGSIAVYGTTHLPERVAEDTPLERYPEKWNHYVREKVESERIVWDAHERGTLRATSLRPSIVLGPRDRNVVTRFARALELPFGRYVGGLIGSGDNRVPCIAVEDVAELALLAIEREAAVGRAYNASSVHSITQREILRVSAQAAGAGLRLQVPVPRSLAWASATLLDHAWQLARREQEPIFSRFSAALLGIDVDIDCTRASRELGWRGERDLADAIRRMMRWHVAHERTS
jgi:nucleoside-diphosphate-sugar epimerase